MKMKEFGPRGRRVPGVPPLDPPLQGTAQVGNLTPTNTKSIAHYNNNNDSNI